MMFTTDFCEVSTLCPNKNSWCFDTNIAPLPNPRHYLMMIICTESFAGWWEKQGWRSALPMSQLRKTKCAMHKNEKAKIELALLGFNT